MRRTLSEVFMTMKLLRCAAILFITLAATILLAFEVDRCLVPAAIREPILNEFSGELALRHVEMLSVDRNRQAKEYEDRFFETQYVAEMAEQYGMSDVKVDFFPSGEIWDAEEADLWLIEPVRKKFAGLEIIPESLASGSLSADVETEVVYVGTASQEDYEGKSVAGKIILSSGSVGTAFRSGVVERDAAGALGTGSPGMNSNYPGFSQDQVGWQSVRPGDHGRGFGFVLSKRQLEELRGYLDRGQRVVMRAHVKTRMYPYKMNVVSAAIEGTDPGAGELLYVAHLFERIGTPGANDNCSGVANILETGRTLSKLIDQGVLNRPKRTIRFLWVPEIRGSRAFMYRYPDLEDKLLAVLNFDMTGADLETTDTYLRMKMTPDSVPSYLNDLVANLLLFVDQTDIRTPWGNNSPFNYRLVPYISGSDHTVFLPAGIAAMQFNHWPDNFYHSSEDRSKYVDPTELKRVGLIAGAGFYYLANAESGEAKDLAWESAANGEKWLAEVARQSIRLLDDEATDLHENYKAARNKVDGAYERARGAVESVLSISNEGKVTELVRTLTAGHEVSRDKHRNNLEYLYRDKCSALGVSPRAISLTEAERQNSRRVPRKLFKYFSDEYRTRGERVSEYIPEESPRMPRLATSEIPNFIDGARSILEIYNLVRAEYGNVNTSSSERKFAYIVEPDMPDVKLQSVVDYIQAMEKAGLVEIRHR
jgi:hypothetical protein